MSVRKKNIHLVILRFRCPRVVLLAWLGYDIWVWSFWWMGGNPNFFLQNVQSFQNLKMLNFNFPPNILVFVCKWNSYRLLSGFTQQFFLQVRQLSSLIPAFCFNLLFFELKIARDFPSILVFVFPQWIKYWYYSLVFFVVFWFFFDSESNRFRWGRGICKGAFYEHRARDPQPLGYEPLSESFPWHWRARVSCLIPRIWARYKQQTFPPSISPIFIFATSFSPLELFSFPHFPMSLCSLFLYVSIHIVSPPLRAATSVAHLNLSEK